MALDDGLGPVTVGVFGLTAAVRLTDGAASADGPCVGYEASLRKQCLSKTLGSSEVFFEASVCPGVLELPADVVAKHGSYA